MSMRVNEPQCLANLDPRGMVGRIYVGDHLTLLHTKYLSSGPQGFRKEDFLSFSHHKYGSYMLPWKPEFQSDQPQNLMQPFPPSDNASHEI